MSAQGGSGGAIRPFRPADAEALGRLTLAAIRATAAQAYTSEQVAAWAARHPDPRRFLQGAPKGDTILVATDGADRAIAYALMEPTGHIDMLYCHPDHGGRGVASALLVRIEADAARRGLAVLLTEASEVARPVFARTGFEHSRRRNFALEHAGRSVPIHNYAMAKPLSGR